MIKKYYRICKGLNDKGKLIPWQDDVYTEINNFDKDAYKSLYYYNQEQFKQFNERIQDKRGKWVDRGCSGIEDVSTDTLIFDFDLNGKVGELEICRKEATALCLKLEKLGINKNSLKIFFSGNKGFNVEFPTNKNMSPTEVKAIAQNLAREYKSFDDKVYNASRYFRIPYTKHPESGLYKIPITFEELSEDHSEYIVDWAKEKDKSLEFPKSWKRVVLPDSIYSLKDVKKQEEKTQELILSKPDNIPDLSKKPSWLSNWKFAILNGYFPNGCRNHSLLILASTCKGQGFPKEVTFQMLRASADLQNKRYGGSYIKDSELTHTIISQVYGPTWKGGTFAEENFNSDLKEYLIGLGLPSKSIMPLDNRVFSTEDVFKQYRSFVKNLDKNTLKTGIEEFDKKFRITTNMMIGILGSPGSGKTSIMLDFLKETSKINNTMLFSLDMPSPLICRSIARKFKKCSSDELDDFYRNASEKDILELEKQCMAPFKKLTYNFKGITSVDDIPNIVLNYQDRIGEDIPIIGVDYLEKVPGPYADDMRNTYYTIDKLQEFTKDHNKCIPLGLQPQKLAGDPNFPIVSYRQIKGSSIIEQDCRFIMSIFREGYRPDNFDNDQFMSLIVLKNNQGMLGRIDVGWDGVSGTTYPLNEAQRKRFEHIKRENKLWIEETRQNRY